MTKIDRTHLRSRPFTHMTALAANNADKADLASIWLAEMDRDLHGVSVVDNVKQTITEATSGRWAIDSWEVY